MIRMLVFCIGMLTLNLHLVFNNVELIRSGYNKYPANYSKLISYLRELILLNGCEVPNEFR